MFTGLLDSVGNDPEIGYAYQEKKPFQWRWYHFVLILVGVFPYICIFVLFGMVDNIKKETTNNNYYSVIAASAQLPTSVSSLLGSSAVSAGTVVSLTATGQVQAGAGTSVYKNIVPFNALCPSYLSMDAVYSNAYLVSYADKTDSTSTLQVAVIGSQPNTATIKTTQQTPYFLYEVVSLSQDTGLFVGITQDTSADDETAYIVAGTVDGTTYGIDLGAKIPYDSTYSVAPQISRLSDNSFAIAYYTYYPTRFLATRFGYVTNDRTVTLSAEVQYQDNSANSTYADVVGLSSTQYMLLFYNSNSTGTGSGPLNVQLANIQGDPTDPATATLALSAVATLQGSALNYYFASTLLLGNETVVTAYVDANNNNGLTAQVITIQPSLDIPVVFGASWQMTSGAAQIDLTSWVMDLDIAPVSTAGSFMVLYSDVSNGGAMTATMGQMTDAGDLVRASPDFILNGGNPQMESVYSWGAIASGVTASLASQTAILTSLTNFDCSVDAVSTFSLMEVKPLPFGLVTSVSKSGVADVAIAGTVSGAKSGLTVGVNYYATTMGGVVPGAAYYGHEESSAGGSSGTSAYYYVESGDTLVTLDGKVGLATAANAIYMQPQ